MKLTNLNPKIKKILASGTVILIAGSFVSCLDQNDNNLDEQTVFTSDYFDEYNESKTKMREEISEKFKRDYEAYGSKGMLNKITFDEEYYQNLIITTDYSEYVNGMVSGDFKFYLDQQEIKKYLYEEEKSPENAYYIQRTLTKMVEFVLYPEISIPYSSCHFESLSFNQQLTVIENLGQTFNMLENSVYHSDITQLQFGSNIEGKSNSQSLDEIEKELFDFYGHAYRNARKGITNNKTYTLEK